MKNLTKVKHRGSNHSTVTEAARIIIGLASKCMSVKMIHPGPFLQRKGGRGGRKLKFRRKYTVLEVIVTANGEYQHVFVHTLDADKTQEFISNEARKKNFAVV